MRGLKAKRLRRAGLKSGPAKKERTEKQIKAAEKKIAEAKKPYSERRSTGSFSPFANRVRENIIKRREESLKNDNA